MSFKSSALYSVYIVLKCWGLDLLARSHSRISVGATRGSFWVVTNIDQLNCISKIVTTQNEPRVTPTLILLCERTNKSKPQHLPIFQP